MIFDETYTLANGIKIPKLGFRDLRRRYGYSDAHGAYRRLR